MDKTTVTTIDAAMLTRLADLVRTRGISIKDAVAVLHAVAPAITVRAKVEALRDMAFDLEQFEAFPGEEPQRLRDRADEIERGDRG